MTFRNIATSQRFVLALSGLTVFFLFSIFFQLDSRLTILENKSIRGNYISKPREIIAASNPKRVIVYNRVPKTGSTSFMGLAYDLCSKNKFNVLHMNISKNSHIMSLPDQGRLVWNISEWDGKKPALYHGHVSFLDFTKFGAHSPLYINIIRQPLDRLVSYYYFLRYGDDYRPHVVRKRQGDTMSFDECIKKGLPKCDPNDVWLQIPFFCGQHPDCWVPGNVWAYEKAKANLQEKYMLVGVTEQMEEFVAVLEATLPSFFKGALKLYQEGTKSHLRKTRKKFTPNAATIERFRNSSVYQLESEFYDFAVRQFQAIQTMALNSDLSDKGQQFFYEKIRPR